MAASSSRGRSSSPYNYRKPSFSQSYSSSSSSSSLFNGRHVPRSYSSSASSHIYNGSVPRSMTPSKARFDVPGTMSLQFHQRSNYSPDLAASDPLIGDSLESQGPGESISVTVRFRPLNEREYQHGDEIAWYADGDKLVRNEYNPATVYAFDRVFGPSTTSQVVYDVAARHVVKGAMEGVNGTVFAYGVTSSGKTHTMHGDQFSPGVIPLAIKDVFSIIQDTPGREFLLRVSYLEIYNEVINDLLDPTGQNLRVREDAQGTYVEGIKEEVVLSPGHALSFIAAGEEHRHVGSNNFNLLSSRSHTIFTLMIESSAHGDDYDGVILSQLNLIDLAGSESSKTETTGLRRKEGSYINKSLLTLGTVIGKLSDGKASHIPYRDSKLTRLLQSSLSGHGHVSLICTVTPASSNMEETHNTLKFASRAKRVEIRAARNRIIDEKSLIKKYQKEISNLKQELDQLKKGMLVGINEEEILTLRQKLEEGQVKMQSRLEEEEEAKAALMSRIQRLTKLILVSTKNTIPGSLNDGSGHHRRHSFGEDDKLDKLHETSSVLLESENPQKDSPSSALSITSEQSCDTIRRSFSKRNDEQSPIISSITESSQAGDLFSGTVHGCRTPPSGMTMADEMDLLVEQVKMLAGEVAFSSSTLKRLKEQSLHGPDGDQSQKSQIQKLETEIQEKQQQMRILEKRIRESGEASLANASSVDMQQTVMRLMTQCNEKAFELELKSADNRILQEQLNEKILQNNDLQEKNLLLQQQLASMLAKLNCHTPVSLSSELGVSGADVDELKKQILFQGAEVDKVKMQNGQLLDENNNLHVQNQKLADDASYAKELASAAAVELKNLADEVTKLSLQNEKQAKELSAAQEISYSRGVHKQSGNGGIRRYSEAKADGNKMGRKCRPNSRSSENPGSIYDDVNFWNLDPEDLKRELLARKQREAVLEAALAEKELVEEEYQKKLDDAKKREADLENDLAGMWVLVAKLKKEGGLRSKPNAGERVGHNLENGCLIERHSDDNQDLLPKSTHPSEDVIKPILDERNRGAELENMVVQLKTRMVEKTKENGPESIVHGDEEVTSHVCKVCFETAIAAVLLPCRHFCLCKPCSLACSECPLCRTKIADRIIAFTS
ncbi:kinesin-like protein KIN-7D, mitochondrial isoform X1 [Amborella trichopoda]|uniref:kinesin-like protein KIN-7D, mitochondrial isoform X1 n=1 Tax=Amborella trichopoda TaxID=13333 RepID=UPI0005D32973|nr:kinesin-like protein KIN-7D, mitochondrial isoform X1 [Amborella trichopoda]|eukprot:XP_011628945.1 kinesin-like protein KIN-7D, mitochondrial isoform X1 [Amborella trichopoda]